jgi:Acetyltransferases, including N-acetylases of ribosomal proteins
MPKIEAPTLETERLVLRRRKEEDIPSLTKMLNEEPVRQYLGGNPPREEHAMLKVVRARKQTDWHILQKDSGTFIGECGINKITDHYLGEIGYVLMEEYWGNGFAFEAVQAVIGYSFDLLNLSRLCATIDKNNLRSRKLIERLGFTLDAVIPQSDFGGRIADVAYYSFAKESRHKK